MPSQQSKRDETTEDEARTKAAEMSDVPASDLSAAELLELAAQALERRRGPRAVKHYRMLADDVRALVGRIE